MRSMILAGLALVAAVGCSGKEKTPKPAAVDLVDGIPARWDPLHEKAAATLVALRTMPATERQAYLNKEWPTLTTDVVAQLRMTNRLPGDHADSVVFHFGSGQGVRADDRTADKHDGFFSDELVAYVYNGRAAPVKVLVRCLNGLFVVDGSELRIERSFVQKPTMRFTVNRRRGLNAYVDYATSISLAERFDLPLYRGRVQTKRHKITPAKARALADSIKKVQVTVRVFTGDTFDLGAMTYKPARRATK